MISLEKVMIGMLADLTSLVITMLPDANDMTDEQKTLVFEIGAATKALIKYSRERKD